MKKVLIIIGAVIVIAAAGIGGYLLNKKPQPVVAAKTPTAQVATCKSGTSQTLGNAEYLVGTDLAPGNYTVKDATQSTDSGATGWSNIDIYAKQSDFKGHNAGGEQNSIVANAGETTNTMLRDGEYVSIWADSAVLTCQ